MSTPHIRFRSPGTTAAFGCTQKSNLQLLAIACLCIVFALLINCFAATSAFAQVITLPKDSTSYIPGKNTYLKVNPENLTVESDTAIIKNGPTDARLLFLLPRPEDSTATKTFKNPCTLTFKNVGVIGRHSIDFRIKVNSVTVHPRFSKLDTSENDTYFSFGNYSYGAGLIEFGSHSGEEGFDYRAQIDVDCTFTVTWSENGKIVGLPFISAAYDLDRPTTTSSRYDSTGANGYAESWTGISGFSGDYYVFPSSNLLISGNKFIAHSEVDLDGNDSWFKGGVVAPTTIGTWRSVYSSGNNGIALSIYSSYLGLDHPTKSVDNSHPYHEGDTVTYSVSQKIGVWNATYATYQSIRFEDRIPAGLTYSSMKVIDDSGKDLTKSGSVSYSASTKKAAFDFNDTFLATTSNYSGKTITCQITCVVDKPAALSTVITNVGTTVFSNLYYDTNPVDITVHDTPSISITKTIPKSSFDHVQGNPWFVFEVEGNGQTRYALAQLDSDSPIDSEGNMYATCVIEGVSEGVYTIREIPSMRYKLSRIYGDGEVDHNSAVIDLDACVQSHTAFANEKRSDFAFSDSSAVVNHFAH